MVEPVVLGDCTLYCGDCLNILPSIEHDSVNIVLNSPPYNVGLKYKGYNDKLPDAQFRLFMERTISELVKTLSDNARVYLIVSDKMLFNLKPICERAGLTFRQMLEWCKPNLVGGGGKISGDWNYMVEHIMLFGYGTRASMLNGNANTHNYFVIPSPQSNFKESVDHPAQFPLKLVKTILSRTPGDIVIDPFMGSGSVGVACSQMGRKFIDIEIVPEYFELSVKRIKEAQLQIRMEI